ncbi:MAG: DHH family phosphoesterase [Candidatus Thorarchaeota archaeon]|nr:DHH family phosphoesterase [Candidatus Thorarchaeota archaeon]
MVELLDELPSDMVCLLDEAAAALKGARRGLVVSHNDADGISALAILLTTLQREGIPHVWRNIHQLNSDTVLEVAGLVREHSPDLVVFTDLGSGQMPLILDNVTPEMGVTRVIVLDHHLLQDRAEDGLPEHVTELNPNIHGMSGSNDVSGAGMAFLLSVAVRATNTDLSELAVVGASGDMQDYYGKGFVGLNARIVDAAKRAGYIAVERDLTFFGINTRPLAQLLEYATEPYLPGLTGNRDACYSFFTERGIPLKSGPDEWRTWSDLNKEEKQLAVQGLIDVILEHYADPSIARGIIGDVFVLCNRPRKSEMRSAKEFSTLLNACGRNRRAEVGVEICLGSEEAYELGKALLQRHRANLADALRRLETGGASDRRGMYYVNDPLTPDTIVGIVIGMAQAARIVPDDRPVIGVSTNTTANTQKAKLSGRAPRHLVDRGLSLKEVFANSAKRLNERHGEMLAEGGGHPMAAGAFVRVEHLDEYVSLVSDEIERMLAQRRG